MELRVLSAADVRQALPMSRAIEIMRSAFGQLCLAYRDLGQVEGDEDHPGAIQYYEQALTIAREIGDRKMEGQALGSLGLAYSALGQVEKAKAYWQQSLTIFEDIKSPHANLVRSWLAKLDSDE